MKRALIVSDTHGREENLERVLAEIGMPDALIHLGDSEGGEDTIPMLVTCPVSQGLQKRRLWSLDVTGF